MTTSLFQHDEHCGECCVLLSLSVCLSVMMYICLSVWHDTYLSRDAPIIESAVRNALYRQVFYIGYQVGICSKLLADTIQLLGSTSP